MAAQSKIHYAPETWERMGQKFGCNSQRGFSATFGIRAKVCAAIWIRIPNSCGAKPQHLLWTLLFLKQYTSQDDLSGRAGCCRNTFSKWTWAMIDGIASLYPSVVRINIDDSVPANVNVTSITMLLTQILSDCLAEQKKGRKIQ